jgi:hypothetical protein
MVPTSAGSPQVDFWKTLQSTFLEERGHLFVFIMGQQKMYTIEMG